EPANELLPRETRVQQVAERIRAELPAAIEHVTRHQLEVRGQPQEGENVPAQPGRVAHEVLEEVDAHRLLSEHLEVSLDLWTVPAALHVVEAKILPRRNPLRLRLQRLLESERLHELVAIIPVERICPLDGIPQHHH